MSKKRASRPSSMPRAITPGLATTPSIKVKPGTYPSPMHLERHRQYKPEDFAQLYFKEKSEVTDVETIQSITTSGLDKLSVGEKRALMAVQILLYETDFRGHHDGKSGFDPGYKGSFTQPVLRVTPSQFYEAYGLEKIEGDGKEWYSQEQRENALEDLENLAERRFNFCYERKKWTGSGTSRRETSDIAIGINRGLIAVTRIYRDLEQEEAEQVKAGDRKQSRLSEIMIECGVPLIDQVDKYYALKYRDLYREIQSFYPKTKQPVGISEMVEYLWTLDFSPLEMRPENLARIAGLGYLIDQRKKKQALKKLDEFIGIVQQIGYIAGYKVNSSGNYEIDLNPEKCSRYEAKLKRLEKLEKRRQTPDGSSGRA